MNLLASDRYASIPDNLVRTEPTGLGIRARTDNRSPYELCIARHLLRTGYPICHRLHRRHGFEVDPVTHLCLAITPTEATVDSVILSSFTDFVPHNHAPEVRLTHALSAVTHTVIEQGPDSIGGLAK